MNTLVLSLFICILSLCQMSHITIHCITKKVEMSCVIGINCYLFIKEISGNQFIGGALNICLQLY
jgi:hypothetical protein